MSEESQGLFNRKEDVEIRVKIERSPGEPTVAFQGASWAALLIGVSAYLIGLFNAGMELNEKGCL